MDCGMSSVPMNLPMQDLLSSMGITSRSLGGALSTASGEDAFLAIIQQMIAEAISGKTSDTLLADGNGTGMPLQQNRDAETLAQYMAGLLFLQPNVENVAGEESLLVSSSPVASDVSLVAIQAGNLIAANQLGQEAQPQMMVGSSLTAAELLAETGSQQTRMNREAKDGMPSFLPVQDVPTAEAKSAVLEIRSYGANGEVSTLDLQSQFQSAVEEARKQIGEQKTLNQQSLNVDQLQNELNTQRPSIYETVSAKLVDQAEAPSITQQLTDGFKENLLAGKREFLIKLQPESLGEITVKLVEKGGKLSLSILTASEQTARMINSDLYALREAVRPLQVEVHEVSMQGQAQNQTSGEMTGFNFYGQQFAQQQQAFYGQSNGGTLYQTIPVMDELEDDTVLETGVMDNTGLDTYI